MPRLRPSISNVDRESYLLWEGVAGDSYAEKVRAQRIVAVIFHNEEEEIRPIDEEPRLRDRVTFFVEHQERDAMGEVHWKITEHLGDAPALALVGCMLEVAGIPTWLKDWHRAQSDRPVLQP